MTMKEKSDVRWGCDEDGQDCYGSPEYAVIDHFGYGYEFPACLLGDAGTYIRENGNGWIFCRVRLFTLH